MKKVLSIILTVLLLCGILPAASAAEAEITAAGDDTVIASGIDNVYTKWSVIKGADGNILQFEPATSYTPVPVRSHGYDAHNGISGAPWMSYMTKVSQIILLPGVGTVQMGAFRSETYIARTTYKYYGSIRLEAYDLSEINGEAFRYLGLGEVVLHSRVTYIGKNAFASNPIKHVYVDDFPDYFASGIEVIL